MTSARLSAQAGTFAMICQGAGLGIVLLDENGEPTAPREICPDCALNALTGIPPTDIALGRAPDCSDIREASGRPNLATRFTGPILPRGPPGA